MRLTSGLVRLPPMPITRTDLDRILAEHPDDDAIRVFVETGTFHGDTTAVADAYFDIVHTIELSPVLYQDAQRRLPTVLHHQGDSQEILPVLAQEIDEPAVFFLDANWWHRPGTPARPAFPNIAGEGCNPLEADLRTVASRKGGDVVILYGTENMGCVSERGRDWRGITHQFLEEIFPRRRSILYCSPFVAIYT